MKKAQKVLIVDDEPNIVMTLDFLMRKNGFQVFIARDGAEALETIQEESPELILLDIMMPNVNGYEVCRQVKETHPNTKVIFISAKSKESDIQKGYDMGADFYMTKPFSTRALAKKAKELLT